MPTPDIWSNIVQHIDCTKTLLNLRRTSKAFSQLITIDDVIGAPINSARVLWDPKMEKYEKISVSAHEDMEGVLSDDGNKMWVWVYTNPIRLTQYEVGEEFKNGAMTKHIVTFVTPNSNDSLLWLKVADNGIICLLSTTQINTGVHNPVLLSVLRRFPDSEFLEMILVTELDRKDIMRRSLFEDETDEYVFSRNSLQCFTWNHKTFVIMLPVSHKDTIALLEVQQFHGKWRTWRIDFDQSKYIGCIKQANHLLYILPAQAGAVFVMDLSKSDPSPKLLHLLPILPNTTTWFNRLSKISKVPIASMMEISPNGENFIVYVPGNLQVLHLTKTSVRPLEHKRKLNIGAFSLLGNDAAVCFMKDSTEYRLYNLKSKDFVKAFHFPYTPIFSLMKNNCIWSIDQAMAVYRQTP
jgi:hypothetical protein